MMDISCNICARMICVKFGFTLETMEMCFKIESFLM